MVKDIKTQKEAIEEQREDAREMTRKTYEDFYIKIISIFDQEANKKALGKHRNYILSFFNGLTRPLSLFIGSIGASSHQTCQGWKKYGFFRKTGCAKVVRETRKDIEKTRLRFSSNLLG